MSRFHPMPGFYHFAMGSIRWLMRTFSRWEVRGLDNLPNGAALLSGNHVSFFDPELVCAAVAHRDVTWLAKQQLYRSRLLAWMLDNLDTIPLNQEGGDVKAFREALRRLEQGRLVGIYPQGGISMPDRVLPLLPGVAFLAHRAQVPVVPVAMAGTRSMIRRAGWRLVWSRVQITFGEPLPPPPPGRLDAARRLEFTQGVMDAVDALLTGAPRSPAIRA